MPVSHMSLSLPLAAKNLQRGLIACGTRSSGTAEWPMFSVFPDRVVMKLKSSVMSTECLGGFSKY